MKKFQNKYRIPSARAQWWDYGNNAAYFITICTHNREHFFGKIENRTMQLSDIGRFAESCWWEIPNHFPFVQLGAFVVMPNHVHGIIIIDKPHVANVVDNGGMVRDGGMVETQNFASLPYLPTIPNQPTEPSNSSIPTEPNQQPKNKFGPQSQNLASIIRGYKIGVTKQSKSVCPEFKWQSRYHDHIIRNDAEYQRIHDYIENNPFNWATDKFYQ